MLLASPNPCGPTRKPLRIAWVTRSFLDYRIPVFKALDELLQGRLHMVYSADYVPERIHHKNRQLLGERAIGMGGEWKLGPEDRDFTANRNFSLRFQPGLLKTIRQIAPDVLVCDGFFKWTFPALLHRIRRGTPLVILYERTAHTERRAQWIRTVYRKFALRFTDAMSCNGSLSRDYVVSLGYPPERITLGHMAADTEGMAQNAARVVQSEIERLRQEWLSPSSQLPAPSSAMVFLYVGRLIKSKGLKELLEGWVRFNAECRISNIESVLVLVGQGPEEQKLRRHASVLGLHNVRFVGPVDYDRLAAYYAAADAFIIPTLEDNWSLVVPEAMACGLPILCSKYNGCWPELVQEGRNGWVFDPFDPQDIARCLNGAKAEMLKHGSTETPLSGLRSQVSSLHAMGEQSREILKDHTPRKAADTIYRACEIAVGQRAKPR